MKRMIWAVFALMILLGHRDASAQRDPDVGNIAMSHKKTLLQNLETSPIHKRMVEAITAAGATGTLGADNRVTLFAPTDDAFAKLPAGTLTNLLKPENQDQLKRLVLYHLVQGRFSAKKLAKLVKRGKGMSVLTTLAGGTLTVKRAGTILTVTDAKGGTAVVTTADVDAKRGTMHVIDAVLMP